jgi:hypothetical protein
MSCRTKALDRVIEGGSERYFERDENTSKAIVTLTESSALKSATNSFRIEFLRFHNLLTD